MGRPFLPTGLSAAARPAICSEGDISADALPEFRVAGEELVGRDVVRTVAGEVQADDAESKSEGNQKPAAKEKPLLLSDDNPLLLLDDGPGIDVTGADNSRCQVCHLNLALEELAKVEKLARNTAQEIRGAADGPIAFEVDPFSKHCLLNGLDDIALTLQHEEKIAAFEATYGIR